MRLLEELRENYGLGAREKLDKEELDRFIDLLKVASVTTNRVEIYAEDFPKLVEEIMYFNLWLDREGFNHHSFYGYSKSSIRRLVSIEIGW